MNWQWNAFAITFATVFLAELGDKTQIATINFAARGYPVLSVFAGSACALFLAALMGAAFGAAASRFISPEILSRVAGIIFVVMGALMFMRKI